MQRRTADGRRAHTGRVPPTVLRPFFLLLIVALLGWFFLPSTRAQLFNLTGKEDRGSQLRGLYNLAIDASRPPLDLAPGALMEHVNVNPFGINTFLQSEVEVAKRERSLQLIRDAGFVWIRQQFPWSDIEIHGKGDFEDRRNTPARSAWEKYDNIVTLAEQHGVRVIARLDAPPKWAHEGYADLGDFGPPANFANYADFAEAVARRYKGRITHYQIWNEPNIFPEWGDQAVNPEDYAKLLCQAHARIKAVDPAAVVIAAALAPTVDQSSLPPGGLSDLIFLQRMYNAGAGRCFDVMSAQGYGLWTGPGDHRRNPQVTNVARHMLIRDIMVRNGDARKAIWLSELNWNTPPVGVQNRETYGVVSPEEQARFVPMMYDRARSDWPWLGVMSVWFFKRADDSEKNQSWYYFRMFEPDFMPTPLYDAMKNYIKDRPR